METPLPYRCSCGTTLQEWRYLDPAEKTRAVWAGGLADLVAFQTRRGTQHDVLDSQGRRVQRGQCAAPPDDSRSVW